MDMKKLAYDLDYPGLTLLHYHYAIMVTLDCATCMVNDGELELPIDGTASLADWVCDMNDDEFHFDDDDWSNIVDILTNEYSEEITDLIKLIEYNQKPKSWAYLTKYQ